MGADWKSIPVLPWTDPVAAGEIDDLATAAAEERADALGEIVAQHEEFASYFMRLLTMTPLSHPGTYRVMAIASIVSMFTVLYFKNGITTGPNQYKPRPRPSHVCPALSPPVPVPGHASYPSGHATEAKLIALVVQDILKDPLGGGAPANSPMINDLDALAARIARNREIAGLHYETDSAAGQALAAEIFDLLKGKNGNPGVAEFLAARGKALDEWNPAKLDQ